MKGRTVDLVLAGSGLAAGALMYVTGQYQARVDARWLFVPLAVCCSALLLRRSAPVTSVLVGTAAVAGDVVIGPSLATPLVYTQVLYDACLHGSARLARTLLATSVVGSVVTAIVCLVVIRDVRAIGLGVLLALVTIVPVLTGTHVRHHRDQAETARRSAQQVARLAAADRANAVAAERAGMARELHDVIANHLSAVAIHATAALSTDLGADGTRQALGVIRENSVQGLAEMRRMVGFLRDPAALPDNAPGGLRALDDLVARAGLPVRLDVRHGAGDVPVSVDLAAYRIIQESLTNALKHGDGGPVTVEVDCGPAAVTMRVTSGLPRERVIGEGAGLIGMHERAALLGGELTAGERAGQWVVEARLPCG
ncbi:histidine kinase [Dactylosporangium vinaceum]|uniref:histidine kinase n=1 Tax=Dactylosporangium vinaceum TaxID=53362 RepID=A0ABV5MC39_9ACTN|nr:histidine kinase [Dactylosporangium vinaceum]